jgi:hypothetical protein
VNLQALLKRQRDLEQQLRKLQADALPGPTGMEFRPHPNE